MLHKGRKMKLLRFVSSVVLALPIFFLLHTTVYADEVFSSSLDALQVVTPSTSLAAGSGSIILKNDGTQITVTLYLAGLEGTQNSAVIRHSLNGDIVLNLTTGNFSQNFPVTPQQVSDLRNHLWFFEIVTSAFPAGELRGRITKPVGTQLSFPNSSGALDEAFGSNGLLSTQIGFGNAVAQATVIQPDGKIVVAGYAYNGTNNDFAVIRYEPNGTLDAAFDGAANGNGIVTIPIGNSNDEAFGVSLQPDGKLILAGQSFNGVNTDVAFARLNNDGTLDSTFGQAGRVTVSAGGGNDLVRSVAVQPDGRIVAAGNGVNGANSDIVVVRLEANGALDASFDGNTGNGNGIVFTAIGPGNDSAYSVALQPDGRIVVAGFYFSGVSNDTAVLRYESGGRLDQTFAGDGIATRAFSTDTDEALAMALQPDGKIVIAGCIRNGAPNDFLLARFDQDGGLDTQFGNNGSNIVPFSGGLDIGLGVAIQPDGKIVAAGFGNNGANADFAVIRTNANGLLDPTFGTNGKLLTMIGTGTDLANAVAIQADGKIVVVGRTAVGTIANFGVARFGYGLNESQNDGLIRLDATTAVRFENANQRGLISVNALNSGSIPPLPSGWSFAAAPRVLDFTGMFSGGILVRYSLTGALSQTEFDSVRILQFENGLWADKTIDTPVRDFATKTIYARVSTLSLIAAALPGRQTQRPATVSGRITNNGLAIFQARLSLRLPGGAIRYAIVNPSGYFRFRDISTGGNYILNTASKRGKVSSILVSVHEDPTEISLITQ